MTTPIQSIASKLADRAQIIVDEGHKPIDIMKSAFSDFKALGSMSGALAVMTTGKLNPQQIEIIKRIAVKVLAILSKYEND